MQGHTAKEQKMGLLRNATLVGDDGPAVGGDAFITNLIISTGLVLIAGCMAGATMNLTGLDPLRLYLRVLAREGDENFAKRAHSVTKDPHLLLVTLLLCNAAANEALPIFLGRIVDPMLAIIISVTCVLFFGEIIPSAICLNPSTQLRIAACSAPFVKVLICRPVGEQAIATLRSDDARDLFKKSFDSQGALFVQTSALVRKVLLSAKKGCRFLADFVAS